MPCLSKNKHIQQREMWPFESTVHLLLPGHCPGLVNLGSDRVIPAVTVAEYWQNPHGFIPPTKTTTWPLLAIMIKVKHGQTKSTSCCPWMDVLNCMTPKSIQQMLQFNQTWETRRPNIVPNFAFCGSFNHSHRKPNSGDQPSKRGRLRVVHQLGQQEKAWNRTAMKSMLLTQGLKVNTKYVCLQ